MSNYGGEDGIEFFQTSLPAAPALANSLYLFNTDGKNLQVMTDSGSVKSVSSSGDLWIFVDEKPAGTNGGTFNNSVWETRTLNTVAHSAGTDVSLSSNQITMVAGTYKIVASAPGFKVGTHKTRFQNITDATTALVGTSEHGDTSANSSQTRSFIMGTITIASTKTFEFQHQCNSQGLNTGLGDPSGFSTVEVYAQIMISKIA